MLKPQYSDNVHGPGFTRFIKFVKQIPEDADQHKRLVAEVVPRIVSIRFLVEEWMEDTEGNEWCRVVENRYHEFGNVSYRNFNRNTVIPDHIDEDSFRLMLALCETAAQNEAEVAVWRFFWNLEIIPAYHSLDGGWLYKHFPNYMQIIFDEISKEDTKHVQNVMET
jgi:hypothetical protein